MSKDTTLFDLAERTVAHAKKQGAQQVSVAVDRDRFIELEQRDGKLERVREASSSSLSVHLYVDGRYSAHSTSDLRWEALAPFVARATEMTRLLSQDPHRKLADPSLYADRPTCDLELRDGGYDEVDSGQRRADVAALEAAAHAVEGPIISVTAGYSDSVGEGVLVHSNGFSGETSGTAFWAGASVSVQDEDGRKPSDGEWCGARFRGDLPDLAGIGRRAARRALGRLGQQKLDSGTMPVVFENRAAGGVLRHLLSAMYGASLQQKRSFLLDKLGQPIASEHLTLIDEPLRKRGFGSRHFDGDGISAHPRTLIDKGRLASYLIDVYYANKMGVAPTGGGLSNLTFAPGARGAEEIIASIDKGIYVMGLLGGNSDTTSGDFSHGVMGYAIEGGKLTVPIGEMNITGNHTKLWDRLIEVGNDPYPYSRVLTPTLVFDDVSVSGA